MINILTKMFKISTKIFNIWKEIFDLSNEILDFEQMFEISTKILEICTEMVDWPNCSIFIGVEPVHHIFSAPEPQRLPNVPTVAFLLWHGVCSLRPVENHEW